MIEKIVIVTRHTPLEDLIYRLNTRSQARFYLQQNQVSFDEYERFDQIYHAAFDRLRSLLPRTIKYQCIDREMLPTFQFGPHDLVITLGPDGLVINTAKYLDSQPLLAFNPDPSRIDGILVPFSIDQASACLEAAQRGRYALQPISMAQARLNDGQSIYAVNDLFIGARGHVSARYHLALADRQERQSSSGIIVSTGAGCTGWLRALTTGAWEIARYFGQFEGEPPTPQQLALGWDAQRLWFTVREPFVSRTSSANLVFGQLEPGQELVITSQMPDSGIIFSDGIESDYLAFNSGAIARIGLAERTVNLIIKVGER